MFSNGLHLWRILFEFLAFTHQVSLGELNARLSWRVNFRDTSERFSFFSGDVTVVTLPFLVFMVRGVSCVTNKWGLPDFCVS